MECDFPFCFHSITKKFLYQYKEQAGNVRNILLATMHINYCINTDFGADLHTVFEYD